MSDNFLQQQSADLARISESVQEGAHSRSFTLLSEEAQRLKNAYNKLQERFQAVNQELGTKNGELNRLACYLGHLLKNVSDAVLFIDLGGTVAIVNEAAQKILKIKAETILYKRFWDHFSDDYFGFSMREALKFGIPHKLLYKTLQKSKEAEISTSFVFDGPKIYHGMILVLRDISEKQELQLVANRNHRMKELGEMSSQIAHEIRNPLGGIRGYASLLFRDLEEAPHLQEMAGLIIEGTKSLEKMVTAVLHYSKPIQIEIQTIEIGHYLKQIGKFVKVDPAFPENVKFEMHIPSSPLFVPFDPEALKSALLNLIFNAFQAMPDGGIATVSLLKMENNCQIAVSDTGIGIEEEQLGNLFSPFFTTKQKGNGLGLVETQKIAQAHFGKLEVRSQPGKGSTFTLSLPMKR